VECHLSHDFIPKMIDKSRNGWNHSKAFTLQNFPEPIRITPPNAAIVQDNCMRCHADFVHDVTVMQSASGRAEDAVSCVHCHKGVGHAPTRPTESFSWISGDLRAATRPAGEGTNP
jgi:cytochrome c nitrite reductase small subunit